MSTSNPATTMDPHDLARLTCGACGRVGFECICSARPGCLIPEMCGARDPMSEMYPGSAADTIIMCDACRVATATSSDAERIARALTTVEAGRALLVALHEKTLSA